MDPLTHGMASLILQRGFFPRASWRTVLAIVFAGVVADVDWFSSIFGPSAYLRWNRSATHSVAFVVPLAFAALGFAQRVRRPDSAKWAGFSWLAITCAGVLHILMDLLQADSVLPFWPISGNRLSLDLAPAIDPWLIAILALAILFPELFRLVSDEIGARTRRPRGRNGAITGFALVALYLALRAFFHGHTTASLESRVVAGEMPRRVAAFPDSISPFLWHSIVETQSALHLTTMRSMGGEVTNATGVTILRKPEPSSVLSAAQSSPAAIAFLQTARFPKAIVETGTDGFSVEIQDLKDQSLGENDRAIVADIMIDKNAKVLSSELQWQKSGARR
jgi:membrane-bound metal-dependent hydrolase YbcI (DUF457 family)